MNWFSGDISEAVKKVKSENKFLVVFIKALMLDKASLAETQFQSVYPSSNYPSIHVIDTNGKRVRVIEQALSKKALLGVIKGSKQKNSSESQGPTVNSSQNLRFQDLVGSQKEKEIAQSKREADLEKKEAAEARIKILQQIEDDKKEKEFRKKMNNLCDGPACPLVNPHITRKRHIVGNEEDSSSKDYSGEVRIRIKFNNGIGGSITVLADSSESIISKIRPYLLECNSLECSEEFKCQMNIVQKNGYFFTQLRPPRKLKLEDERKSFADLGLAPNGVLIINQNGGLDETSSTSSIISMIPNTMISIISWSVGMINSTILRVIGMISGSNKESSDNSQGKPGRYNNNNNSGRDADNEKRSKFIRKGNVSRLSHMPDNSDDEQARWNGNSTSQL